MPASAARFTVRAARIISSNDRIATISQEKRNDIRD